jgi:hypothetical protein
MLLKGLGGVSILYDSEEVTAQEGTLFLCDNAREIFCNLGLSRK